MRDALKKLELNCHLPDKGMFDSTYRGTYMQHRPYSECVSGKWQFNSNALRPSQCHYSFFKHPQLFHTHAPDAHCQLSMFLRKDAWRRIAGSQYHHKSSLYTAKLKTTGHIRCFGGQRASVLEKGRYNKGNRPVVRRIERWKWTYNDVKDKRGKEYGKESGNWKIRRAKHICISRQSVYLRRLWSSIQNMLTIVQG